MSNQLQLASIFGSAFTFNPRSASTYTGSCLKNSQLNHSLNMTRSPFKLLLRSTPLGTRPMSTLPDQSLVIENSIHELSYAAPTIAALIETMRTVVASSKQATSTQRSSIDLSPCVFTMTITPLTTSDSSSLRFLCHGLRCQLSFCGNFPHLQYLTLRLIVLRFIVVIALLYSSPRSEKKMDRSPSLPAESRMSLQTHGNLFYYTSRDLLTAALRFQVAFTSKLSTSTQLSR